MIEVAAIADAVRRAISLVAVELRPDALVAMETALGVERAPRARRVLEQLIDNARIARTDCVPLCQDTGTVWVWLELGGQECVSGDIYAAVDAAVADAYRDGALRMSVARDALTDRTNTTDNTPAFIDITFRPRSGATVHVMLKGGGSDNSSVLEMLEPAAGMEGVRELVLRTVSAKATGACPPLVVGVGVGATFDKVALLAKKALLRPIGEPSANASVAAFERELLDAINASGIGPAGMGGDTTALAVNVLSAPCHIASLPVAVNMGCCAVRSVSIDVV
ncbi:MAG: fumarate hydratase [Coriobacteriia bacterium]|nr:fumarate hydratase [Coriobacteriia bacterium]